MHGGMIDSLASIQRSRLIWSVVVEKPKPPLLLTHLKELVPATPPWTPVPRSIVSSLLTRYSFKPGREALSRWPAEVGLEPCADATVGTIITISAKRRASAADSFLIRNPVHSLICRLSGI